MSTTGVRETEAASQIETAISTGEDTLPLTTDPAQLPELLDQMIALGQRAQELRHCLGGNGHWPEELKEIVEYLGTKPSK